MQTAKWTTELEALSNTFNEMFGQLTAGELHWKPNQESWSIAQNIEHLIVTNETYFPILKELRNGNYKPPFTAKIPLLPSLFGKMILKAVNPSKKNKMKTFSIWEPKETDQGKNVVPRFLNHQEELIEQISKTEKLLNQNIVIASPANRSIIYKLPTAYDIIVTHEKRHLNQAMEVVEMLKKHP